MSHSTAFSYNGCFSQMIRIASNYASEYVSEDLYTLSFSANAGNATDNPMAGHANGDDIHPYNISMIPIIIVS